MCVDYLAQIVLVFILKSIYSAVKYLNTSQHDWIGNDIDTNIHMPPYHVIPAKNVLFTHLTYLCPLHSCPHASFALLSDTEQHKHTHFLCINAISKQTCLQVNIVSSCPSLLCMCTCPRPRLPQTLSYCKEPCCSLLSMFT